MVSASFGVLSQNSGFYPSLDRIIETTLRPLNLGPGGRSYNEPISRLHRMGSSLNDSPKQSFVFLDRVSASPGSVSCHSLYKCEAPTLNSASLFIWQLVIPRCRIPNRTNELSNACRAC